MGGLYDRLAEVFWNKAHIIRSANGQPTPVWDDLSEPTQKEVRDCVKATIKAFTELNDWAFWALVMTLPKDKKAKFYQIMEALDD